jgi:non-specific protein-tyrosine kinase
MQDLGLQRYLTVIRRWLWLVAACALLAAGAAYFISSRMTPVYSASTTLLVRQAPTAGGSDYNAVLMSDRLALTYAQMLREEPVLEAVIEQLGMEGVTPGELASWVRVELVRDTQLIRLSVEDTDSSRAAEIANAIADAFIAQNKALQEERYADSLASMQAQMDELSVLMEETQAGIDAQGEPETARGEAELARLETILAGYRTTYASFLQSYEQMRLTAAQTTDNVIVFREARPPTAPVRPRKTTNTALAGVVGVLLAIGVAFLIEYLDDTLKTPEDVRQALNLGTLGAIGRFKKTDKELILIDQPLSPIAEAFRALRTSIRFSGVDEPLRTLLVTSPGPTEGKSLTVANLAVAMAQSGLRVVAVDGDLRRPRLHKLFGVRPRDGLTGSLLEGSMDGRLQPSPVEGLAVLPAGELPPNPAELLGSRRMRGLLGALTERADVVVLDSPPVMPVTDAVVLAQAADGVLLVVDVGNTRRETARQAVEKMRQIGANVIGVVFNKVPMRKSGYYYYYYYYYHHGYYGQGEKTARRRRR